MTQIEDINALHGQCFGAWVEQVEAEMERSGATPFDILTVDWNHLRDAYYNLGISAHDTVCEEMIAL